MIPDDLEYIVDMLKDNIDLAQKVQDIAINYLIDKGYIGAYGKTFEKVYNEMLNYFDKEKAWEVSKIYMSTFKINVGD